ncbi:MAG: hypothetical protein MUP24_08630 [Gillisia sp.]|nr:hypothetical protein [Gillisia sp.]
MILLLDFPAKISQKEKRQERRNKERVEKKKEPRTKTKEPGLKKVRSRETGDGG